MKRYYIIGGLVFVLMIVLGFLGWYWNITGQQWMNRQTIDQNAQKQIQVNQYFHQLQSDIHTAYVDLQNDTSARDSFVRDNPDYQHVPQLEQIYEQMVQNVIQDRASLTQKCSDYTAELNNSDYRGYDSNIQRSLPECAGI